jgi:LysR family hydrogen peroxide-inducible transcriptional activator
MTLTELRYIIAVAREQHFGRAAKSCFVSQPTLSVAIKKLEDELDVILFERHRSEVTLTPLGEEIVQQAQQVLEQVEGIKQIAQQGQDPLHGPLRLGAIYTIGPYLLPKLIPALHKRAPNMPLVIQENYTVELTRRLKQGELDAIVIALPYQEPGIVTLQLYQEPFKVVLPTNHAWNKRKTIPVGELANENLLLLGAGHCFREQVIDACPACIVGDQRTMQQTVEGTSLETIRHMVASGLGITVLPCTAVEEKLAKTSLLAIRPFSKPAPGRTVALAWRASFPRPKAIEALRQSIQACKIDCVKML